MILWGKKRIALSQTYNWEKFFQRAHTYLHIYTQIRGGGLYMPPPPGPNRLEYNWAFLVL